MPENSQRDPADRIPADHVPEARPAHRGLLTSDIPEEWRDGRYVTLTVGGKVDMAETYPTDANPEARG